MANVETTINVKIAEILRGMRSIWEVSAEQTRVIRGAKARQPDILITHPKLNLPPVIIENEFMPASSVEEDAIKRLGVEVAGAPGTVEHVLALRTPDIFRKQDEDHLLSELADCKTFEYALFTGTQDCRFPENGWMQGALSDVALLTIHGAVREGAIIEAVEEIENTVNEAVHLLSNIGERLEEKLKQKDGEQTRRMAAVILLNAFIFYDIIAPAHKLPPLAQDEEYRVGKNPTRNLVMKCWSKILEINYYPIFEIALYIIRSVPSEEVMQLSGLLHRTAERLLGEGVIRSHDLFGAVFQRLIADRKYLAAFYTRPSAAALLAGLAVPEKIWDDPAAFMVTDPACGTGTLLSAAYRRISELHELNGGDMAKHHGDVMSTAFTACDVMPAAVHLTTAMLAGSQPGIPFKDTHMYLLPYGVTENGARVGSVELLQQEDVFPVMETSPVRQTGSGEKQISMAEVKHREASLVIMNPPYTRQMNQRGITDISVPAFAAFGHNKSEQRKLSKRYGDLTKDTCAHGNAGLSSAFVELAHRLLADNGRMAMVLPLSVMAGSSWSGVRELLEKHYDNIICLTLAAPKIEDCAFSADTGMAEVLLIAQRQNGSSNGEHRGVFVCLTSRPQSAMEAAEYARVLRRSLNDEEVRRLEDGPYGGTPVYVGGNIIGEMLDAPLQAVSAEDAKNGADSRWPMSRIQDLSLAQIAYALYGKGVFWLPKCESFSIPVCSLSKVAKRGVFHIDINSKIEPTTDIPRGPFDIHRPCPPGAAYPCLWTHHAKQETRFVAEPDCELRVRRGVEEKAEKVWSKASRVHHNRDFRFNSQSLAAAFTEMPTLGGRAWPNLCFVNEKQEILHMLWANSTPGLLSYWWLANKQQGGRGGISIIRSLDLLTLDISKLNRRQLKAADDLFNALKEQEFLPAYLAPEDQTRIALDEGLFGDVLGLDIDKEALAALRYSFGHEPSVSGGKRRS